MKSPSHNVVHTAIPTHDKFQAKYFYGELLGGTVAREYPDRVTFELFDHQLVCHFDKTYKPNASSGNPFSRVYPRHFGMTFLDKEDFLQIHRSLSDANWEHLQPIMARFEDLPERHLTFFVADPTLNIVEFKYYEDAKYVY